MHARTAIDLPVFVKDARDLFGQFAIFPLVGAGLVLTPFIVAAHTHSQRSAQCRDRILLAVLGNERITQGWLREKVAKAFFKMSRS